MTQDVDIINDLKRKLHACVDSESFRQSSKRSDRDTPNLLQPYKHNLARFLILNPAEITDDEAVLHVARALVIVIDDTLTDKVDAVMPSKELKTCFGPDYLKELEEEGSEFDHVKFRFSEVEKIFVLIPLIISSYYDEN